PPHRDHPGAQPRGAAEPDRQHAVSGARHCALCGFPKPANELHAFAKGAACWKCAAAAVSQLEARDRKGVILWTAAYRTLGLLAEHTPFERTEPLVGAALALAAGDPVRVRTTARAAARVWRHDLAARALDDLAELGDARDAATAAYFWFCHGQA